MKKLMMAAVGAIALSGIAQEVTVTAPVAVPAPVTLAPVAVAVAEDIGPGALCRVYLKPASNGPKVMNLRRDYESECAEVDALLASALPPVQGYDDKSTTWDGKNIATGYKYDLVMWDGVLIAKQAGTYVFTIDSYWLYGIAVNGKGVKGAGQQTFTAELAKGPNSFFLWRKYKPNEENHTTNEGKASRFSLHYRLATSTKPTKAITPSMLSHVIDEGDEW